MKKLQYQVIDHAEPHENPIVKESLYQEAQIGEITRCWDEKENCYEVLIFNDEIYFVNEQLEQVPEIETDDWAEDDITYYYKYNDEYYEQYTNGNHWYKITEPKLIEEN